MKVTLPSERPWLKALGHVHRIVERRNTIPQILSNVLIEAQASANCR